ncbi:hypothetical protein LINGRAHAP2_LOCUS24402 [Linum grandiflorum]
MGLDMLLIVLVAAVLEVKLESIMIQSGLLKKSVLREKEGNRHIERWILDQRRL